ncbi:FadR/GntR family transcriptional regulator [Georgenia deserti]|uniref:FadR/GntR family transcriptional regulator n=1 Tax=Georgenia deserti TaxID=2093781 RepID=A0ABW4KZH8_9MICO
MTSGEIRWKSLGHENVSSRIVTQVRELVRTNQLSPGDRLPSERELAALLGVSRPSLREALKLLQAQGVLEIRHGHGVFVSEPRAAASLRAALIREDIGVDELFAMREVLELPAAAWAAERQNTEALAALEEAHAELDAYSYTEDLDYERLRELDAAFHLSIVAASGNRFLRQTTIILHEILAAGMQTTLRVPGRVEKSREDHRRILEAILAGDVAGAREAAQAHVRAAWAVAHDVLGTPGDGPPRS